MLIYCRFELKHTARVRLGRRIPRQTYALLRHSLVQRNDRGPFFSHWDMCDFLERHGCANFTRSIVFRCSAPLRVKKSAG